MFIEESHLAEQKLADSNRLCNEIMLTALACVMTWLTSKFIQNDVVSPKLNYM